MAIQMTTSIEPEGPSANDLENTERTVGDECDIKQSNSHFSNLPHGDSNAIED